MNTTIQPPHVPFSLVLSGGGALALAQLGVLADMEEIGWKPHEVVGTSMGGLIGAMVAVGLNEATIYRHLAHFSHIGRWFRPALKGYALSSHRRIEAILRPIFEDRMMHETDIPLLLTSVNMTNGHARLFTPKDTHISLIDALIATLATPGIIEGRTIASHYYADGFLYANLPVHAASYTHVVALDAMGEASLPVGLPKGWKLTKLLRMHERTVHLMTIHQTRHLLASTADKALLYLDLPTHAFTLKQYRRIDALRACAKGLLHERLRQGGFSTSPTDRT